MQVYVGPNHWGAGTLHKTEFVEWRQTAVLMEKEKHGYCWWFDDTDPEFNIFPQIPTTLHLQMKVHYQRIGSENQVLIKQTEAVTLPSGPAPLGTVLIYSISAMC